MCPGSLGERRQNGVHSAEPGSLTTACCLHPGAPAPRAGCEGRSREVAMETWPDYTWRKERGGGHDAIFRGGARVAGEAHKQFVDQRLWKGPWLI